MERVEALKHRLDALQPFAPEQLQALRPFLHAEDIQAVYASNAIEGNTLTLRETALVVDEGRVIEGKSMREHQEALALAKATEFMRHLVDERIPLDSGTLLEMHRLILTGTFDEEAGRYRSDRVYIRGSMHVPPNPLRVPELMEELWKEFHASKESLHPIYAAADFHHRLVRIHPFRDGNGRTARLATDLHLLQNGYARALILPDQRASYFKALEESDIGNPTPFREFIIECVSIESERYLNILNPAS